MYVCVCVCVCVHMYMPKFQALLLNVTLRLRVGGDISGIVAHVKDYAHLNHTRHAEVH